MDKTKSDKIFRRKRRIRLIVRPSDETSRSKGYEKIIRKTLSNNALQYESIPRVYVSPCAVKVFLVNGKGANGSISQKTADCMKKHVMQAGKKDNNRSYVKMPQIYKNGAGSKPKYASPVTQMNSRKISPLRLVARRSFINERVAKNLRLNFGIDLNDTVEDPSWTCREKAVDATYIKKTKKAKKVTKNTYDLNGWD